MDYIYIVNAFKQQQQLLLHQHQLQQQLQNHSFTTNTLSFQQQLDNTNMSNSLIWQPWRDLQQAAVHHHLYQQQQQKLQFRKENRLTSKELPTTGWRRERRLRTGEYHVAHHHPSPGSLANSVRASSPISSPPPPNAHAHLSCISSGSISNAKINMRSNAHNISIVMAGAGSMRPLNEPTNHSDFSLPHSNLAGQIDLGQISHSQVFQHINSIQNDDAPLDMSVGNLKQRNSPPPPYREPLPGSQFASSLARPSVITQAPPKRDVRDSTLVTNRENDNRSCESIDEHFRRSLGNDYFSLFSKRSPASQSIKTPSPQPHNPQPPAAHIRSHSPTLPSSSAASPLPPQSTLIQSELIPPPTYPINLPFSNHQQNSQQALPIQAIATPKANDVLLKPTVIAAEIEMATRANSPPLSLIVRPNALQNHQHNLVSQKSASLIDITPLKSPKSPIPTPVVKLSSASRTPTFSTAGSRTASPLPLQQQTTAGSVALTHTSTIDNSPTSSPHHTPLLNVAVPSPSPNLPAIMRIKPELGLQNVKSNNPTPPASPTLTTNYNIDFNTTSNSSNISAPSSPKTSSWKPTTTSNTTAEVLASVDDHFAKALGATWKKLQGNKDIRK